MSTITTLIKFTYNK